jgi:hypothetical protein
MQLPHRESNPGSPDYTSYATACQRHTYVETNIFISLNNNSRARKPSGTEPGTFRLVAWRLSQLRYSFVSLDNNYRAQGNKLQVSNPF